MLTKEDLAQVCELFAEILLTAGNWSVNATKKAAELRAEGEKEKDREKSATNEEHVLLCADLGCVCNLTKDEAFRVAAALRRGEKAEEERQRLCDRIQELANAGVLDKQRIATLEAEKASDKWTCKMSPEEVARHANSAGFWRGRAVAIRDALHDGTEADCLKVSELELKALRAAGVNV